MDPLEFPQARAMVIETVRLARHLPPVEEVALDDAAGRVLAVDVAADRDSPALDRSARDGYAVRAADLPGELEVIGEVRAGERFAGTVGPGQAVEIMTGAPVPAGADAVIMVEDAHAGNGRVRIEHGAQPAQAINPLGSEATAGETVLRAGTRLDYTGIAALAAFGHSRVAVYRRPTAAIVATG
ncbi:MAG: molybdopterin molybdenumtransferase MoeA, partial [Bryobacteraceae bacterium]